ncbi:hypothetical protein SUGI_0577510 [Cryptomeria japonica]|nr:hypothetical protein SUGI_0577510 [Cryptomeria japonica]
MRFLENISNCVQVSSGDLDRGSHLMDVAFNTCLYTSTKFEGFCTFLDKWLPFLLCFLWGLFLSCSLISASV